MKRKITFSTHLLNGLTVLLAAFWLFPLVITLFMSVRPANSAITNGNILLECTTRGLETAQPGDLNLFGCILTPSNYQQAWSLAPWGLHYQNSLIFVFGTLIVQVFTVTLAGYAFARMQFRGRELLLNLILLQLMIPAGILLVQNYSTINGLGLFNTHWALMLPYWGSAFGVLLLRQTFREIPYELEEAARIDGANVFEVLRYVYVPLSIPAYVAFALVSISSHWNEFLWPLIITNSDAVRPLTLGLNKLIKTADQGALYSLLMAGTILVITPLVIMFMLFQRRFIESFASSGIK
jgi:sn-glycerol 3-phosphate transport system permease protein